MGKKVYLPALLWKRIIAFVIDLLVLDVVVLSSFRTAFSSRFSGVSLSAAFAGELSLPKDTVTLLIAVGIFALLYFVIMEYKLGQSVGKILMNLSVVSVDNLPLTFWQCVFRSLYLVPVFPFIVFWIIDPIYMFFDLHNQRLLERWSKTMTVQIVPPAWYKVKSNEIPAE